MSKKPQRKPVFQQKNRFQWHQNDDEVHIYIPCGLITQKDIRLEAADNYIRIMNSKKPSQNYAVDLLHQIDIRSKANKAIVNQEEKVIELLLKKKQHKLEWESLQFIPENREDLTIRRNQAIERLREFEKLSAESVKKIQTKMDKKVVEQQMRIEGEQRQMLEKRQKQEKEEAEKQLYQVLESKYQSEKGAVIQAKNYQKQVQPIQEEKKIQSERSGSSAVTQVKPVTSDIFGTNDMIPYDQEILQQEQELIKPISTTIRQQHKQEIKFSEKKYPHMPTRQSHLKQPPYPKSKNYQPTKQDMMIDIEERNPVWLKDKGDHFFEKNDFKSAINAYTKAIENDKDFVKAYVNRATCLLLIHHPKQAIQDCYKAETIINSMKDEERKDPFYQKIMVRCFIKKAGAKAWLSMFSEAITDYEQALKIQKENQLEYRRKVQEFQDQVQARKASQAKGIKQKQEGQQQQQQQNAELQSEQQANKKLQNKIMEDAQNSQKMISLRYKMIKQQFEILSSHQRAQIQTDIQLIKQRISSQLQKQVGDAAFERGDFKQAILNYQKAIEIDPTNQYAFANLSIIYMKQSEYNKCIEYSTHALSLLDSHLPNTRSFSTDNRLEVKLLFRRGLCYQKYGDIDNAKKDLDKCVSLQPNNSQARGLLRRISQNFNNKVFERCREEGRKFQQSHQLTKALQKYEQCLKIIQRKVQKIQHVSVFASKASCLLGLQKYQDSLRNCNDAIRLLKNYLSKSRTGVKKTTNEVDEKERARQMEYRILLVKTKALCNLGGEGRDVDASKCIDEAGKLAKGDKERKVVQKLKKSLGF